MAEHHLGNGVIRRDIGTPDILLSADPMTVINPEGKRNYGESSLNGVYARTAAAYAESYLGSGVADDLWVWAPEYALPGKPTSLSEAIERLEWSKRMCDAEIERLLTKKIQADTHAYEREMLARKHLAERRALDES